METQEKQPSSSTPERQAGTEDTAGRTSQQPLWVVDHHRSPNRVATIAFLFPVDHRYTLFVFLVICNVLNRVYSFIFWKYAQ